jgi:Trk K+ transport system NAD-binding subunit
VKRKPLRTRIARALRFRIAVAAYVLRRLGPPFIATIAYITLATVLLRWDYKRTGLEVPEFGPTVYSIFRQLFFEPAEAFPTTAIARAIVLITPLVSVFLLAQGLFKIGASLLDLESRREVWVTIVSGQMRGHIVVCGLGHVGYRVVEELRMLGEDIIAIEVHETEAFVEAVRLMDIPVHVGDARRDDLLRVAGVARAKAVVCATSNDLANLEIALDAKRMNPQVRVVMRMFDQRLAGKVGGALELDQSFSTSSLAAPLIAIQATQAGVHSAYRLDDTVRVTAEVTVAADAKEATVTEIEERAPCRVVSRKRGADGHFTAVRPRDAVHAGDVLIVDTAAVDLPAVRFQLGGR